MSQTGKIHLNFRNGNDLVQMKVKPGQKLKKALGFYCNNHINKPREVVRFFHNKKELFENDSAKSINLVENDIIDVVLIENLHNKPVVKTEQNSENQTVEQQNLVSEQHAMSIDLQVDNPVAMDQTEPNSENETQINDPTTLVQTLTENSELNAMAPEERNSKRKHDDEMNTNESPPKISKMVNHSNPIDSDTSDVSDMDSYYDMVDSFLDVLVTSGQTEYDKFYITEIEPLEKKISEYESQIKHFKQALNDAETKCHNYALQLKQQCRDVIVKVEQSQIDVVVQQKLALEMEKFKTAYRNEFEQQVEQSATSRIEALKETHRLEIEQLKIALAAASQVAEQKQMHIAEMEKLKLEQKIILVKQQESAQDEINRMKTVYENRIFVLQKEYDKLNASLNASNGEKSQVNGMQEEAVASQVEQLNLKAEIEQCKQAYEVLRKNYEDLSQKYNTDILRQNQSLIEQQQKAQTMMSLYKNQLDESENRYNVLKYQYEETGSKLKEHILARSKDLDDFNKKEALLRQNLADNEVMLTSRNDMIVKMQIERNNYLNEWKRCKHELDSTKKEYNLRIPQMIAQTQQQMWMQFQNQVMVPISTPSPASTPQPPETTSTPPPTTPSANTHKRKCMQCGGPSRMAITVAYCNTKCKHDYFKDQLCEENSSIQTDV